MDQYAAEMQVLTLSIPGSQGTHQPGNITLFQVVRIQLTKQIGRLLK